MGLPPYERPEEPEREVLPAHTAESDVDGAASPPLAEQTVASSPAPKAAPAPVEEAASAGGGGMMGKLFGKKKNEAPPAKVDTRRRRYNQSFGKKSGQLEGEGEDTEQLSPQEDRARTASALRNGRASAVGVVGAGDASEGIVGGSATTAEEVKTAAKAREADTTTASAANGSADVHNGDINEPADVHDDEAVPAIVASSSLAPALTGGYLDEKVPSYDLTDPSKTAEEKSNGHAKVGVAAAGLGAAGVGAAALASHGDESEKQNGAGNGGIVGEEEEQQEVAQAKAPEPRKQGPKRAKVASLTPVQRHYLLKALVSIQMQQEFTELEKLGALTQYGYPFSLERPKLKRVKETKLEGDLGAGDFEEEADDPYADADADEIRRKEGLQEPLICRHMFHVHLHSFPGLDDAPSKYWQKRIQPFFDEMAARNFSTSMERGETTSRRFYTLAMTRYLGGFFSRGFGVRGEGELRGAGKGAPGSDRWGKGKEWGKGTVKRGLDKPARPDADLLDRIDALFDGRDGEVWKRARKETTRVRRDWCGFKEFVIERESGLEETMNYLDVGNLRNLPNQYRNAEEYARMHAAYIFHTLFVSSPSANGFYSVLKGIHTLFPYWGAKQLLKVANAQTMIQGILSLLLARPAGAKSLVQRIFVSVIGGQASTINKEYVQPLRKEIGEPDLCAKIEEYVKRGNRPEGKAIRARAVRTGQDVVATILLFAPGAQLGEGKKSEVLDMHDAFARSPLRGNISAAYPTSTPIGKEGKEQVGSWGAGADEERAARKFAMLKLFLRETLKRRDREEACKMASGSLVPSIIKDSLDTVFYGPIKHIAEVSDLSARLGDLQNFLDDLIKTKKAGDDSLPAWIALTARHENSLYFLFHECAPIMKPFVEWLQLGADYMALSTTDPGHPANRKAKNVEINLEEMLRDDSLTDDDVGKILAEVDQLATYVKWQKVWYELEMRKNFLLARSDAIPASGLSQDDIAKGSNMRERIEDVDGLLKELMQQERAPVEEGVVENEARGTEMRDFPWAWFDAVDPLHQHLDDTDPEQLRFHPNVATTKLPTLLHTRKALTPFRQTLLDRLPAWKEGDAKVSVRGEEGECRLLTLCLPGRACDPKGDAGGGAVCPAEEPVRRHPQSCSAVCRRKRKDAKDADDSEEAPQGVLLLSRALLWPLRGHRLLASRCSALPCSALLLPCHVRVINCMAIAKRVRTADTYAKAGLMRRSSWR